MAQFCHDHLDRVEYFEYLQWQACAQLEAVAAHSQDAGLGVGVMVDLAIGVAEGGGATWTDRRLYALDASVGAPPDDFNRLGQNWGLPPWIPHQLTAHAYAPYIEMLRANMRYAGALRKDHIMGLCRLFWVAKGLPASEGAYVRYPFEDMLGILALESQRNRCLVVGEDLGTVPDEVRAALHPMNVMSTRLLYFERRDDGRLKPPQEYPVNAVAAVTTHDLPTLAGYWQGIDIDLAGPPAPVPGRRGPQSPDRGAGCGPCAAAGGTGKPGRAARTVRRHRTASGQFSGNDGGARGSRVHLSRAGTVEAAADADGRRFWRARAAESPRRGRPCRLPLLAAQAPTQS